jgi:hypothetical protein
MDTFLCLMAVGVIFGIIVWAAVSQANTAAKNHSEHPDVFAPSGLQYNTAIVCPHCNEKGKVTSQHVKRKKGISGGKATGALLTGGASLLVTGLSRKEGETDLHCYNCNSIWHF